MNAASNSKAEAFRKLHVKGRPFVIPNPWDAGSARILEGLGFKALATSSSAAALTLGRLDYGLSRAEAMAHCRLVVGAVDIPVSADLENGFGPMPEDCAETIRQASMTGLAGGSIEDSTGDHDQPIFEISEAALRVRAAVEAARTAPAGFVLTARAEGYLHGRGDLKDIIARLQAFEDAGADVLFAPGLPDLASLKSVCASVGKPVNALAPGRFGGATLADFAAAGATRISLGGGLANAAYGRLVEAAEAIVRDGDFAGLAANAASAKRIRSWLTPS